MTGVWYGIAAYSIWGLLTLYWRLFPHVPAIQVLGHRIVWAFVVLAAIIAATWSRRRAVAGLLTPGTIGLYAVAAALISINWFLFLWAVNNGMVVASSLGYFITPLVNVLLGVLVLRERLRPIQWIAVTLAFAGVVRLTLAYGGIPWIALALVEQRQLARRGQHREKRVVRVVVGVAVARAEGVAKAQPRVEARRVRLPAANPYRWR